MLLGQDTAILFLGVTLWLAGMRRGNGWLAALGLALTSVRPHLCLAFAIPLLFRDLQIGWKFIIISSLLALGSILLLGWQGTLEFIHILQVSANGSWYGMNETAMLNMIGFISRILPFLEPSIIRFLGWVGYISSILFLSFTWGKKEKSIYSLISLSIILALFLRLTFITTIWHYSLFRSGLWV
ncbi:MAG: hypothetical protein HC797_03200 [Anaerolineales bacterium]|nr:hypothetical protein [Anaerolineales bacterium]